MEIIKFRLVAIVIIVLNIIGFFAVIFFIPPQGFDNLLMLGLIALGQSLLNTVLAGIFIGIRLVIKEKAIRDCLSIVVNSFWIGTALSLLLAAFYCFVAAPASNRKATQPVSKSTTGSSTVNTNPAGSNTGGSNTSGSGLGY